MTFMFQLIFTDIVFVLFFMLVSDIFWDSSTALMPTWWKLIYASALFALFPMILIILLMVIWM